MTDFDYKKCLDVRGRFNISKAKKYLKDLGISEDVVSYVKDNHDLPQEESEQEMILVYDGIDFEYERFRDVNGDFSLVETAKWLKARGLSVTDEVINHITDNMPPYIPPEPKIERKPDPEVVSLSDVTITAIASGDTAEVIETPVDESVIKVAEGIAIGAGVDYLMKELERGAGYHKYCADGSRHCRLCRYRKQKTIQTYERVSGIKQIIPEAVETIRYTDADVSDEVHDCEKVSGKVALISTCNNFKNR